MRPATLALAARLIEGVDREPVVRQLACELGADDLLLLLRDPTLGVLLPAPGLRQTLAGGPSWRDFLRGCTAPGRCEGLVELPKGRTRPALALVGEVITAVLLGGSPDAVAVEELSALLPLLGWGLGGEQRVALAAADAAAAREAAARAHELSRALESARAELARLNLELREEHRRKDEFLAMLAHELRNPLAPLATSIELLRHGGLERELVERQLEVMARQTGQLARLVDDLLDVSRVSRGLIELRRRPLALADVLRGALEAVRPALQARRLELELDLGGEPLLVDGDPVRLTQVFTNLLHNAAKYTDPGGRVFVSARRDERQAVVCVRDTGIGIASEMLPRVFDLFTQAPVALDRAQGGLGIGLTTVRALVHLHGGRVVARSPGVGCGSTFVVELPLAAGSPPARDVPPAASSEHASDGSLRVLVVDDNRDAAESLCTILRLLGHQADVAHDGLEALAKIEQLGPELVLLDLGLPGLDGFEVARRVRAAGHRPWLVALTGYGGEGDRRRSREAGFDEHVVKPLEMEALRAIMSRARRHHPEQARVE